MNCRHFHCHVRENIHKPKMPAKIVMFDDVEMKGKYHKIRVEKKVISNILVEVGQDKVRMQWQRWEPQELLCTL